MKLSKLVIAVAAVALLSTGMLLGERMSSHASRPAAAPLLAATPAPALETFYVPARHVNAAAQGAAIEEPVQEFY